MKAIRACFNFACQAAAAPAGLPPGDAGGGRFEILAMTAGNGNGWNFPANVLRASMDKWDEVECFVDHASLLEEGHSVRDLCGHLTGPVWDETAAGIRLILTPVGPSAGLVQQMGAEMLAPGTKPRVGFSADIGFKAQARDVMEIARVFSVDLVFNPARGGRFLRAVNAASETAGGANPTQGGQSMPENQDVVSQPERAQTAIQPAEEARRVQAQMCAYLLEAGLAASGLPQAAQQQIRARFAGQVFAPETLNGAVQEARQLVASLTAGQAVQGLNPARLSSVFDSRDRLQAAADDLLGAPREKGAESLSAPKLGGIRELYLTLTGDDDLHGGYYPERARLATTADFTGLVKNALNKIIVERWNELGRAGYDWWQKIAAVEHFDSLQQITGTLIGTVGTLPAVAEGAEYTELAIGDSPETADFVKYGGYIPLTLELIDRDETRKLRAYPRELAAAGLRKISTLVAALFTSNAGIGPTLADGGALFNNTAVTSAGGHANLRTTALGASEWDAVCTAVYDQPLLVKNAAGSYGSGAKMAVNPRYLLVPRALQLAAMKILYPTLENAASIYSENLQRGQPGDVLTIPEWTDATDWAAVCDPRIAPAVYVGERFGIRPEVFIAGDAYSPAVFMNDEHRLKVRHFLAVWVNDFRPLHKSNVAA